MKLALLVEYDGTVYHGFQRQAPAHEPTIQGMLETAVERISQQRVAVLGAGRTDTGVHASGQVVHFQVESRLRPHDWQRALNAVLPADIAVRRIAPVADAFHARYSALARSYRYDVLANPWPSPLRERFVHRVAYPLDVEMMDAGCAALLGEHDFRAFGRSPRGPDASCVRVMLEASCQRDERAALISFTFTANGFLNGMVRRLVGTLLLVGQGQLGVTEFVRILESRNDAHPGAAAPACGLCLTQVSYPAGMVIWDDMES
ncbi:MAG TPA: tRNA pseudouridine(38-40) synthase TruA [Ktedonobacterales bacterium]|nr:tRNA pseudouridine(38-40) synthase TruA [Ktedonobacterales bacterium]